MQQDADQEAVLDEQAQGRLRTELAACWAHTRRKFYDIHQATSSPIAAEVLRCIGELYAIEQQVRGQSADERQTARNIRSRSRGPS